MERSDTMGISKDQIIEKEDRKQIQLEGYRKKLIREKIYNMPCPYCGNALSDYDVKEDQCIHCGHPFEWN